MLPNETGARNLVFTNDWISNCISNVDKQFFLFKLILRYFDSNKNFIERNNNKFEEITSTIKIALYEILYS